MSTLILDIERLKNEINKLKVCDVSTKKIYNLIFSCYNMDVNINMKEYIYDLTKHSLYFKNVESKFYPYFDLVLCVIFIKRSRELKIVESEERLKKHLDISFKRIYTEILAKVSLIEIISKEV